MNNNDHEVIFITVGSRQQKQLCEKLILDIAVKFDFDIRVLSDEEYGCRIGSGGSLLRVITEFYNGKKILLINSGGQSKRTINYAVRGKAFCNFLNNGSVTTLLETIIMNGRKILSTINNGVFVCCSDILVNTDELTVSDDNCFGLCVRTDLKTGSRHGVMFDNCSGKLQSFLHKQEEATLNLLSEDNTVLTDTGAIYFNDKYCKAIKILCEKEKILNMLADNKLDLNLYADLVTLFSENSDREEYIYKNDDNPIISTIKSYLYDYLSEFELDVIELKDQRFIHFGSMKEAHKNIILLSENTQPYINLNSFVDDECDVGVNTVLDNVELKGSFRIGSGCFISDITLDNAIVEDNMVVCGVKLNDGYYITIVCDIEENPKELNNNIEIWKTPRFYKGKSYTDSLKKFYDKPEESAYSLEFCVDNADYDYYNTRCKYLKDKKTQHINSEYLKLRESVIDKYMSDNRSLKKVKCSYDRVELNLPVRVNFSGTWTDAMPYCLDNGGGVVNAAITVDGKKPIKVIVERLNNNKIELCSDGSASVFSFEEMKNDDLFDFALHKAAIEAIGITSSTEISEGFRLTTEVSDIDNGSGLGTSSILLGGCFLALLKMFGIEKSVSEVFKMVFVAEQLMKTGGGWQDQVGGLVPAVKLGFSEKGLDQNIGFHNIICSDEFKELFSKRAILVPTGQRHFGRFIVNDVVNRYLDKNTDSLLAHSEILKLNDLTIKSIEDGDNKAFCDCLNYHRLLLKKISPLVSNANIDLMVEKCFEKADAVSFCGAGGGGYLLIILKENISVDDFKSFFAKEYPLINSKIRKIDICCN